MNNELYSRAGEIEDTCLHNFLSQFKYVKKVEYTQGNIVYDAIVNDNIMVEVKVRRVEDYVFNMIKNEGAILECNKYTYLMEAKERMNCKKTLYINFFPKQKKTLVFNLEEVTLNLSEKTMNNQTYSAGQDKIRKQIYLLDFNEAKQYDYYESV